MADYKTVQKEIQRERQQKQLAEQRFIQMQNDVVREAVDAFVGDSPQRKAYTDAALMGIKYAQIADKYGGKVARDVAKKDGIDLGLREFNNLINRGPKIVEGLTTEFQRMPDPKRFGKDKISPVFSYQYEGERGGFGAKYNPLHKTASVSGGMKLGPGTLTGEATVSRGGKSSVGARFTTKFNKGGKVYNKRGQPRKVNY